MTNKLSDPSAPGDVLAMKEALKKAIGEKLHETEKHGWKPHSNEWHRAFGYIAGLHCASDIIAAIDRIDVKAEAKSQEPEAVKVRPLEWRDHSFKDSVLHVAHTSLIEYRITKEAHAEWPFVVRPFVTPQSNYQTLEQAKADVEADYEQRIRSTLIFPTTKAWRDIQSAIEQAIDCIRGETPEDCSDEEAKADTLSKLREADTAIAALIAGER